MQMLSTLLLQSNNIYISLKVSHASWPSVWPLSRLLRIPSTIMFSIFICFPKYSELNLLHSVNNSVVALLQIAFPPSCI